MKKIAEKIALVALICITFMFVLLAVLYASDVIPQKAAADSGATIVVLSVLAAMYIGLSVYLLLLNFSEVFNVKRILLFYDAEMTTRASHKVVKNIIRGCAKEFPQFKIRRTVFRVDDKMGLVANISLESVVAEDINNYLPQLKNLLVQSFAESLGLKFNAINFDVVKLSKKYTPTDTQLEISKQTAEDEDYDGEYNSEQTPIREENNESEADFDDEDEKIFANF